MRKMGFEKLIADFCAIAKTELKRRNILWVYTWSYSISCEWAKHRENTKREMVSLQDVNLPKSQHKHKMTRGFWWQVDFFMQMDFSSNGVVTDKKSS